MSMEIETEVALLRRDDAAMGVETTAAAVELKQAALEQAALIGRVSNATEQERAVEAQREIKRVLKLVEDARKQIKEPVLEYGRKIDGVAKRFRAELESEELRVAKLVGDFQTLELQRIRAEEAARNAELAQIERDRQAALSQAATHEEVDKIQEQFDAAAKEMPKMEPRRVAGQIVTEEWQVEVTDIWALARAHPACVKIEPRLSDIKQLLDIGVKVAGVRASKVVKSGVRVGKGPQAVEVLA